MTVNFSLLALDQIVNNAATIPHMSGGQFAVPLVIRMATGGGRQSRRSTRTASKAGMPTFPGSRCSRPRRSRTRAACSRPALADPDPGADLRARHALQHGRRAGPGGARRSISRAARSAAPGRDVTLITYGGCAVEVARRGRDAGQRQDRRRSYRSSRPAAARHGNNPGIGCQDAARVIVDEAWRSGSSRPRSGRASSSRRSSISTRRSRRVCSARGADAIRASISKTPHCRSRPRSRLQRELSVRGN